MNKAEITSMLNKQAEWQRSRAKLPWSEKLKQSVRMRKTQCLLRQSSGR